MTDCSAIHLYFCLTHDKYLGQLVHTVARILREISASKDEGKIHSWCKVKLGGGRQTENKSAHDVPERSAANMEIDGW